MNLFINNGVEIKKAVSIPKRVLEALNRYTLEDGSIETYVSIPKRVLEALNHHLEL